MRAAVTQAITCQGSIKYFWFWIIYYAVSCPYLKLTKLTVWLTDVTFTCQDGGYYRHRLYILQSCIITVRALYTLAAVTLGSMYIYNTNMATRSDLWTLDDVHTISLDSRIAHHTLCIVIGWLIFKTRCMERQLEAKTKYTCGPGGYSRKRVLWKLWVC